MHCFLACLGTETNTFSSIPTGLTAFADTMLCHGDGTTAGRHPIAEPLRIWRRMAQADGDRVSESLSAFAEPAGITVRVAYEAFRDEIVADLRRSLPVDIVLLSLHGAMVADGYVSTESDLLRHVRDVVGERVTIGVELDLHCHITPEIIECADFVITYKEYPHTDIGERAVEVFNLAKDAAAGRVEPRMAAAPTGINAYLPTTRDAMREFVAWMKEVEQRPAILSVSLGHGFPHGDVPNLGANAIVVADADQDLAQRTATEVARRLQSVRQGLRPTYLTIDAALDEAIATPRGPVVIADTSDNAGCGAPNDSTFVLRRILERGISDVAMANFWDPGAVRFALDAGVGSTIRLRIGGKCGPDSGDPVDIEVRVMGVSQAATQTFNGYQVDMGQAAWVRAGGVDLILNSRRFQTGHPDMFQNLGLDPLARKILVVKSTQHFYAGFAPIASKVIYMAGPGATNPDTTTLPYRNAPDAFWPRAELPIQ